MIVCIDGGNSRIHAGLWDGTIIHPAGTCPSSAFHRELEPLLLSIRDGVTVGSVAACSVNGRIREDLFHLLECVFPGKVHICRTVMEAGVTVPYARPGTFGVDRAFAALAAYREMNGPCVVVDAGTAITVDAVNAAGAVTGGFIYPGMAAAAAALSGMTGLPAAGDVAGAAEPGISTESCIVNALHVGVPAAVNAMIASARHSLGVSAPVVATGGGVEPLLDGITVPVIHRPALVLEGLGRAAGRLPRYEPHT